MDNKFVDPSKVDMYIMTHSKYFENDKLGILRDRLSTISEQKFQVIQMADLQDPVILLVVSLFVGSLGIDRFMLGDIAMGVLKLLTAGLCGILTIIDWFLIMGKTKEQNFNKLMMHL